MELKELYDKLLAEGCNRFYIDGIGGPQDDDVDRLGMDDGVLWKIYYFERGRSGEAFFSSPDKEEAIKYYYQHIMAMQHRHLVTFTRSFEIFIFYRFTLESHGIKTIQNDIPNYSGAKDHVYRLFVVNKDIFAARELIDIMPYLDNNLKDSPMAPEPSFMITFSEN